MELNYSIEDKDGVKVISLDGNISVMNAESLERLVDMHTQKNHVIINMEDVRLITSSGYNSLMNMSIDAKSRNNRVLLMKAGDMFRKMIDVLKNYEHFIMIDSIEEGQMKLKYYT